MKRLSTLAALIRFRAGLTTKVVFVPTMGALHAGHGALIQQARKLAGRAGTVVVSIFVNPTQFGPNEDFARYPRPISSDLKLCRELGADVVFMPSPTEMYAGSPTVFVDEELLSTGLCGAARPGHFRGVCTVVAKLFNLVRPHVAVFGEKDFQQLAILRQMVRDLNFPIQIVGVPTYREASGLAMSSRNQYLSDTQRLEAPALRQALLAAKAKFATRETSAAKLRQLIVSRIEALSESRIDYVEFVHCLTLEPMEVATAETVIAVAVFFGATRLIDNISLAL